MQVKVFVGVGIALGLTACGSGYPTAPVATQTSQSVPAPLGPSITGVVQDPAEHPIAGAVVKIALGTDDVTDSTGRFTVSTSAPPRAFVHFTVYKADYGYMEIMIQGPTATVTFPPGTTIDVPLD